MFGMKLNKPRVIRLAHDKWIVDGKIGVYKTREEAEKAAEQYRW